MSFLSRLNAAWRSSSSLVCVGLDPDLAKLPSHLRGKPGAIFEFNRQLIDATHDLVCCYKPQAAYYAGQGADEDLARTLTYLQSRYPHIPVILDAKRGDIGATAEHYAQEAFVRHRADAVTVNPYMGGDTLEPFLTYADRGVVILCRTSNPGSSDFQMLDVGGGKKLYELVAEKAAREWNRNGNVSLVVGATHPAELRRVREIVGNIPLLVPGVGAQGGDAAEVVRQGLAADGQGLIVNSSRGIIYASGGQDFAEAARKATASLKNELNAARGG